MDYKQAGVDIDAGNETVRRIKSPGARRLSRPGVLSDIGSFGGLFRLDAAAFGEPVLVVERRRRRHQAEGRVPGQPPRHGRRRSRESLRQRHPRAGREPLFFLDYLATGRLARCRRADRRAARRGCRDNGCALLGGETAEMPGFYADGEYDVAGFIVGVVDRARTDRWPRRSRRATC